MTDYSIDFCTKSLQNTIGEILAAVLYKAGGITLTKEQQQTLEFYLDESNALYFSTPLSSAVKSQDVELLREGGKPFRAVVNSDIISTYLTSGELVLVACVANKYNTLVLGAVDRSTGLGLFHDANWVDSDDLIAAMQALTQEEDYSFELNIKEVHFPQLDESSPKVARSRTRLLSLLEDCRAHTLSLCTGLNVEIADTEE